jgi:hypothetical protein
MAMCVNCKEDKDDVELRAGLMVCLQCMRDRYSRALSNYVLATSEEVVETPFGWSTALCAFGEPLRWLCLDIHPTSDDAAVCLADTLSRGEGRFPIQ